MLKIVLLLFWLVGSSFNPPPLCSNKDCVKDQSAAFIKDGWLKYQVRVKDENEGEVFCEVINGTSNLVNLRVSFNQHLIYELRSHEENDEVVVWEKNHVGKEEKTSRVPRKLFNKVGGWDIKCQKELPGCLFGSYWRSWVTEDWKSVVPPPIKYDTVIWTDPMRPRVRYFRFITMEKTPEENLFKKESE